MKEQIVTDLHIKATDRHQYLHYMSSFCHHIKRFILDNHVLRVSPIFSFEEDFQGHRNQMKLWFLNRGYPKWLIDTELEKVKFAVHREKEIQKRKEFP